MHVEHGSDDGFIGRWGSSSEAERAAEPVAGQVGHGTDRVRPLTLSPDGPLPEHHGRRARPPTSPSTVVTFSVTEFRPGLATIASVRSTTRADPRGRPRRNEPATVPAPPRRRPPPPAPRSPTSPGG